MVYFKLDALLKQLNCSRNKFSKISGVRPNTINSMCNGETKRLQIDILEAILKTLNDISHETINIEDILEYRREKIE